MTPWLAAARPRTLVAAIVPVAVGSACALAAAGALRAGPTLAALLGALFIQLGTNLANDLFDAEKGADGPDRVGPTRVVSAGLISAARVKAAIVMAFAAAVLCGAYLTWVAGPAIVVIGLASIASGLAYTGGPWPLGYHGLGDVFVMAFFGFVAVCGAAFVQLGAVPAAAWWAAIPVGALATAILVVNNVRDRETDARVGKRTLAVRLGRRGALAEWIVLVAAAYAVPCLMVALDVAGAWVLLPLASLPLAVVAGRQVLGGRGPELNAALGATARVLAVHGLLFAVGLAL